MKKMVKKNGNKNKEMGRYLGALTEMHEETQKGIKEGFILVNKKLDSHTEMIGVLMEDTSSIKSDLRKKVDYDEFLSLAKGVRALESKK